MEHGLMRSLLAQVDARDQNLVWQAQEFYHSSFSSDFSKQDLGWINRQYGIDFATAVLYEHFVSKLNRSPFTVPRAALTGRLSDVNSNTDLRIAIAPGAFHREHPEVGGDGRHLMLEAQRRGWDCQVIPAASLGTLEENAQTIIDYFQRRMDQRLILVSLSKGTADVKVAMARCPQVFATVAGWISVSGILTGTMMSNWLLEKNRLRPICRFMCWYHKADIQAVRDLRYGADSRLNFPIPVESVGLVNPARPMPMIHIAGFPLRRHLCCWRARLWNRRFKEYGPNDSVILLADLLDQPGMVIPVWGADHYLKSTWNAHQTISAIVTLLANQSVTKPTLIS